MKTLSIPEQTILSKNRAYVLVPRQVIKRSHHRPSNQRPLSGEPCYQNSNLLSPSSSPKHHIPVILIPFLISTSIFYLVYLSRSRQIFTPPKYPTFLWDSRNATCQLCLGKQPNDVTIPTITVIQSKRYIVMHQPSWKRL